MAKYGQNGGPLTLTHDVTPRDFSQNYGDTSNLAKPNYRFQGYPESSFNKPKQPVLGGPVEELPSFDNPHHKRSHFITDGSEHCGVRPNKILGAHSAPSQLGFRGDQSSRPVNGMNTTVEYSSDHVEPTRQTPQPKRALVFRDDGSAEERKRMFQKREAEEDIARFKMEKQQQYYKESEEKRQYLEMLKSYQPFGKPGGGAPPSQAPKRTKNIANMDYQGRNEMETTDPKVNFEFGKPGAGAPIRTDSGHVLTNVRQDAEIHFQRNKGGAAAIHNHKRYTDPINTARNYQTQLDDLALEQRTKKEMEKYNDRIQERKSWDYNPFGRPGAGAPVKTDSGRVKKNRGMTLTNNCYEMRNIQQKDTFRSPRGQQEEKVTKSVTWNTGDNDVYHDLHQQDTARDDAMSMLKDNKDYDPWGKGYGAPDRDQRGYVKRHKWGAPIGIREYVDPNVSGGTLQTKSHGGGGHIIDDDGHKVTKMKTTLEQDKSGAVNEVLPLYGTGGADDDMLVSGVRGSKRGAEPLALPIGSTNIPNGYDPWGKPGAGAPIKTDSGKVVTQTAGKVTQDRLGLSPNNPVRQEAKQQYLRELQSEIETQHQMKQQQDYEMKRGGDELASWMRRGQVGYPKKDPVTGQHLSNPKHTSDVTAQRMDIRRNVVPEYQTMLDRQAHERSQQQQMAKKQSAMLTERHLDTMNTVWGRPGAGAPVPDYGNKKQNLNLERPTEQPGAPVRAPWAVYTM